MYQQIKRLRWFDKERDFLKSLCAQVNSWSELETKFVENKDQFKEGRTWFSARSECNNHPSWRQHFLRADNNHQARESNGNGFMQKFIDYLISGRTLAQIAEKFKIKPEEVKNVLHSPPEGYRMAKQQNTFGEDMFVFLPEMTKMVKPKEKIWTFDRHECQPYIAILFPTDVKWKKINVVPISDVWYGDHLHDEAMFDEYINWISKSPHVFTFFNGDIFKRFLKSEEELVGVKLNELQNKLSRIAHKILWAQAGDHEDACFKKFGYDPLKIICEEFNVPYFEEPMYADIFWMDRLNPFTFFCIHGRTNAQTEGGQMNAARKPSDWQEIVHFYVMGHIKNKKSFQEIKIRRNPVAFELEKHKQYVVICPSFIHYFGSENAKKGYKPHSLGTVSCRLLRDGHYWTSN